MINKPSIGFLSKISSQLLTGLFFILGFFLSAAKGFGQSTGPEESLLDELDSLYNSLYAFDYEKFLEEHGSYDAFRDIIGRYSQEAEAIQSEQAYFKAKNILYIFYRYQSDPLIPFSILDETIEKARIMELPEYEADFLYKMGSQYSRYGQYDSALANYERALDIAELNNFYNIRGATINAIAILYSRILDYPKALIYYRKSLEYFSQNDVIDSLEIAGGFGNLADVYSRLDVGDSTLYYSRKEYEIAIRLEFPGELRQALKGLTAGSYLTGRFKEAISYSDSLLSITEGTSSEGYMKDAYLYRSKSWYALGNTKQAFEDAATAIEMADRFKNLKSKIYAYEWLIELEKKSDRFKEALELLMVKNDLVDSLEMAENDRKIDVLALSHELTIRENSIAALREIKRLNEQELYFKNIIIALSTLVFLFSFGSIVLFYKRRVQTQKILAQNAESKLLLTQLNPHFIFNALTSIQFYLMNEASKEKALDYLASFALLMRKVLEGSRRTYISIEDEISALTYYLELQKVRFDNSFDYTISVDVSGEASEIMIPPMFAQPFIENSLEHGIFKMDNGLIEVSFTQKGEKIIIVIDDNGVGVGEAIQRKRDHQSMASDITNERIMLIKKLYKQRVSFSIKNRLDPSGKTLGTRVVLELPITPNIV